MALLDASERRPLTEAEMAEAEQLGKAALRGYRAEGRLAKVAGPAASGGSAPVTPAPGLSVAAEVVGSDAWREFKQRYPGHVPETTGVALPPVEVSSKAMLRPVRQKAIDGSALATPDFVGFEAAAVQRAPVRLPGLVTQSTTASDLVYAARETSFTNAAGVQANLGDVKPESSLTYERIQIPVETIAHHLSAAKQALSDVGQLSTILDNFLVWGVQQKLEAEMLSGDGSAGHFTGILATSGIQQQPAVSGDVAGIEALRQAIALVQLNGAATPTGVLLSVQDDANLDLARDAQGRYFGLGPFGSGPSTIWGIPRYVCWGLPQGTAVVADFSLAVLWDREAASVAVSDSHGTNFTQNLVTCLGELRAAFAVIRPQAFAVVAL